MTCRIVFALAFSLVLGAGACVGTLETTDPLGSGGGPGGADAGTGGGGGAAAKTFFDTNVEPLLSTARPKGACAACHQGANAVDGPDFLGATSADNYATLAGSLRLVNPANPTGSLLVTKGDHDGDALCTAAGVPYATCTQDEVSLIAQWIGME